MKKILLIFLFSIQTFVFGQTNWTFIEYSGFWGLLPDGDGLSIGV